MSRSKFSQKKEVDNWFLTPIDYQTLNPFLKKRSGHFFGGGKILNENAPFGGKSLQCVWAKKAKKRVVSYPPFVKHKAINSDFGSVFS